MRLNIVADKGMIDTLKDLTKIKTNQDLIDNALALLEWGIKQKQKGSIVGSVDNIHDPTLYKEVVIPALEKVKEV